MTDLQARQHQRAAAQGDVCAEVRHLRQCVRAGDLLQTRLKLAAYCGHEAARVLVPVDEMPVLDHGNRPMMNWATFSSRGFMQVAGPVWLTGLRTLAADLDGLGEVEERCDCTRGWRRDADDKLVTCGQCSGAVDELVRHVAWDGGEWVMLRAAIVSVRLVLFGDSKWVPLDLETLARATAAIRAASDYLRLRTLKAREAWATAWNALGDAKGWIPAPGEGPRSMTNFVSLIQAAAQVVGDRCPLYKPPPAHYGMCRLCDGTGRINGEAKVQAAICTDLIEWSLQ